MQVLPLPLCKREGRPVDAPPWMYKNALRGLKGFESGLAGVIVISRNQGP